MTSHYNRPSRSTSLFSFADHNTTGIISSSSQDNVVSLDVDNLPFSSRKYPASLNHTSSIDGKRSLGDKLKSFFHHESTAQEKLSTETSVNTVSNVEDLLKVYADSSVEPRLETIGDEDAASIAGNTSNYAFNLETASYSSLSDISNATEFSMDPYVANSKNLAVSAKLNAYDSYASSPNSEVTLPHVDRSSSACDTCKSQDSGFSDASRSNVIRDDMKTGSFSNFLSKNIFSKFKNSESMKKVENAPVDYKKKRTDDFMTKTTQTWLNDILPKWGRGSRCWRQTYDLWWLGLPPKVRGQVWKYSIGNDLHITDDLFKICLDRADCVFNHLDNRKNDSQNKVLFSKLSLSQGKQDEQLATSCATDTGSNLPAADMPLVQSLPSILLDLSRTFPQLGLFQDGGPLNCALKNILAAFSSYQPDIGYVQGMTFIASMLLLNMDEYDAFVAFTNLINRPLHRAMFAVDHPRISAYVATFKRMLWSSMPELAGHFALHGLSPDVYIFEWLLPIYCRSFSLDVVSRIWDVYLRDGEHFLFKVALAILRQNETNLMSSDFDQMVAILTNIRAQAELTNGEQLFINIQGVSGTRIASSDSFAKLLDESIKVDANRWQEHK